MSVVRNALGYGAAGMAVKYLSNNIRLLPLRREPWEYVLFGAIGAYIGSCVPGYNQKLFDDINEMRDDRGLPPMQSVNDFCVITYADEESTEAQAET